MLLSLIHIQYKNDSINIEFIDCQTELCDPFSKSFKIFVCKEHSINSLFVFIILFYSLTCNQTIIHQLRIWMRYSRVGVIRLLLDKKQNRKYIYLPYHARAQNQSFSKSLFRRLIAVQLAGVSLRLLNFFLLSFNVIIAFQLFSIRFVLLSIWNVNMIFITYMLRFMSWWFFDLV